MRNAASLTTLLGAALSFFCSASAFAADCIKKPTELDAVICGNAEIRQIDEALTKALVGIRPRLNGNNGLDYAALIADQLRWREQLWRQCTPLGADCLLPKYQARFAALRLPEVVGSELYLKERGIRVGNLTLVFEPAKGGEVSIGTYPVTQPVSRIDIIERFIDPSVDAIAFVANRGGNGTDCGQFPVYIVAVRPNTEPEILLVPTGLGSTEGQPRCVDRVTRTPDGLLFEIDAWPWSDGRVFSWKPKSGLFLGPTSQFKPRAGTRVRDLLTSNDLGGRLNNEQFYGALRTATNKLALDFADAARAFWFSWNKPFRQGDYVVFESCDKPGREQECTGGFVGKAVYEQRTDRFYFAFSRASALPDCRLANGRDPFDAALGGVALVPSRRQWPDGALFALMDRYCPTRR